MLISRKSSGGPCGIVGVSNSHPIPSSIPTSPPSLKPSQNNRGGPRCLSLLNTPPPSSINRLRGDPACLLYLREKGFWIEKTPLGLCVCVCRKWQVFGSILSCYILVTMQSMLVRLLHGSREEMRQFSALRRTPPNCSK